MIIQKNLIKPSVSSPTDIQASIRTLYKFVFKLRVFLLITTKQFNILHHIFLNQRFPEPELGDITNKIDLYAVDEDLYNVSGVIYFTPGCFNGNFHSYILSLLGERDGYETHNETAVLVDYNVSEYDFSLRPEHVYRVGVTVQNTEFNVTKWTSFSSPAGGEY